MRCASAHSNSSLPREESTRRRGIAWTSSADSSARPKKPVNARSRKSDANTSRLHEVLGENEFLGNALQKAQNELHALKEKSDEELQRLRQQNDTLQKTVNACKQETMDWQKLKKSFESLKIESQKAVDTSTRLQEEKSTLLEHSWKCLQQLRSLENDNQRLRADTISLRKRLARLNYQRKQSSRRKRFVATPTKSIESAGISESDVLRDVDLVVGVIERIELEASTAARLAEQVKDQRKLNSQLQYALNDTEKELSVSKKRVDEVMQREQNWIRLVQSETIRFFKLQRSCSCNAANAEHNISETNQ